ncbi:MAG: bifunctional DNA-formamidopyrimidine glycosylase/DNA-(apurinic or apyrimidinic site) lyase [bacterium]|nr:bifunctional DNA-formamidopyrimidine glycosylase/DNA-(apurinic or apyrimidinic site) lyase [bacterium]
MPELPEVETIRRSLEKDIIGKTIFSIDIREKKQFVGDPQKAIQQKVSAVQRKGKVLSLKLSNDLYLSFHLKLTGQILFHHDKDNSLFKNEIPRTYTNKMPAADTRIIFYFQDNSVLYFNDVRKFGWVKLTPQPEAPTSPDILSKEFTIEYIKKKLSASRKPIKVILMDQEFIAGIGNIYANDSLFIAGILPTRKANSLDEKEIKTLYEAIKKVIAEGIEYRGSSAQDEMYIMPDSTKGAYQFHFKVYHRENKPCFNCKTIIKRIKQGGRSSFYCEKCQK